MRICPHCGTVNPSDANYCNKCGTDLGDLEISGSSRDVSGQAADPYHQEAELFPDTLPETNQGEEPGTDRPLFDLGLASPDAVRAEETAATPPAAGQDALTGRGALLAPISLFGVADPEQTADPVPKAPVDRRAQEWLQPIMGSHSVITAEPGPTGTGRRDHWYSPVVRRHWIFFLVLGALLWPLIAEWTTPAGEPHRWPGVQSAYSTVDGLPPAADVMVFWAYDLATAGEMDLVVEPVLEHLILRQANLTFISPYPFGPATAQRIVESTLVDAELTGDPARATVRLTASNVFLPGGAAVLPLLAQGSVTPLDGGRYGPAVRQEMAQPRFDPPALVVVAAADAEEVQQWLEMVQPRNRVATVAVVAAGADPALRPYLDSSQLAGLVGGFDGAYHYRMLIDRPLTDTERQIQRIQIVLQNWGHLVILSLLLTGNLVGLLFRTGGAES